MHLQVSDILQALNAFSHSTAKLLHGSLSCCTEVPRALETPKFAPNGKDFAAIIATAEGTSLPGSDPLARCPWTIPSDSDSDSYSDSTYALLPGDQCSYSLWACLQGAHQEEDLASACVRVQPWSLIAVTNCLCMHPIGKGCPTCRQGLSHSVISQSSSKGVCLLCR